MDGECQRGTAAACTEWGFHFHFVFADFHFYFLFNFSFIFLIAFLFSKFYFHFLTIQNEVCTFFLQIFTFIFIFKVFFHFLYWFFSFLKFYFHFLFCITAQMGAQYFHIFHHLVSTFAYVLAYLLENEVFTLPTLSPHKKY